MPNRLPLLLLFCFGLACGDDDTANDASIASDVSSDSNMPDMAAIDMQSADALDLRDSGADTNTHDSGSLDSALGDGGLGETDAGVDCFPLSGATVDEPYAIPDTLDDSTATWMRPLDMCPATQTAEAPTPYVAYTYCNDRDVATEYEFELNSELNGAVILAYLGDSVPEDVQACAAYAEPIALSASLVVTMEPGQVVTIVSTFSAPVSGEIQSVAGPTS